MGIRRNGPWQITEAQNVYDNPWIRVTDHQVIHPNGDPGQYGVVHFKNLATGVLPIAADGQVWLVGQHRFALEAYSWELPEGGCPQGEDPLAAAARELEEEAGLRAGTWIPLCRSHLSNSVTDERAYGYLAIDLRNGKTQPDPSEDLRLRQLAFGQLLEEVLSGQITDALTQLIVLSAHARAQRGELPEDVTALIL